MGLRRLYVRMDDVLDAMDTAEGALRFFLDVENGEVTVSMDGEVLSSDDDGRYLRIPPHPGDDDQRVMKDFVAGVEEAERRQELARTLAGRGAFRRFRQQLAQHADLRHRWETEKQQRLLEEALAWLRQVGIEPLYELRPLPDPRPLGRGPTSGPDGSEAASVVGLFELLLLGAPDDETSAGEGPVTRQIRTASPEQARRLFVRLARQLTEHHGLPWRASAVDGRSDFAVGRCQLVTEGPWVRLEVEVPPALRQAFGEAGGK